MYMKTRDLLQIFVQQKTTNLKNDHARSTNHLQQSNWIKVNIILIFFFQSVVIMKVSLQFNSYWFISCFILFSCLNHFHSFHMS
jgi:hypothetical protein